MNFKDLENTLYNNSWENYKDILFDSNIEKMLKNYVHNLLFDISSGTKNTQSCTHRIPKVNSLWFHLITHQSDHTFFVSNFELFDRSLISFS